MAFADYSETRFVPDARRVLVGLVAAPCVPAFLFSILLGGTADIFPLIAGSGFLSVMCLYVPLLIWRLPTAPHPLLTCILLGAVSGPGPLGYILGVTTLVSSGFGGPALFAGMLAFTFPLGAVGGFVFWLCVVWRSQDFALTRQYRLLGD